MAISSLLGYGPAYRDVVVNDLLLDRDGHKMSKSRGNVVDPWDAIATFGADAIRWYLITVSQPWVPKRFDPEALGEAARRTFDTLANTYRFFALYARLEGWTPDGEPAAPGSANVLDRWVLSRLNRLVAAVGDDLDAYDVTRAARAIADFVVDDLSNWYVRRCRDRFWGNTDPSDARAAFATLHHALVVLSRLLAPMTPFLADWSHRALCDGASAHLAPFPEADAARIDPALEAGMDAARTLARLGRAARERVRIRVRQPLGTMYAVVPRGIALGEAELAVVRDELNVKAIRFLEAAEELVDLRAKPDFRTLGPRFGPRTAQVADAIRAVPAERLRAFQRGEALTLVVAGEGIEVSAQEFDIVEEAKGDLVVETDEGYVVALDPTVDEALRLEGLARELVNRIQRLRRDEGLAVSDRIRLAIAGDPDVVAAALAHRDFIAHETLAVELLAGSDIEGTGYPALREVELDGFRARIALAVV